MEKAGKGTFNTQHSTFNAQGMERVEQRRNKGEQKIKTEKFGDRKMGWREAKKGRMEVIWNDRTFNKSTPDVVPYKDGY